MSFKECLFSTQWNSMGKIKCSLKPHITMQFNWEFRWYITFLVVIVHFAVKTHSMIYVRPTDWQPVQSSCWAQILIVTDSNKCKTLQKSYANAMNDNFSLHVTNVLISNNNDCLKAHPLSFTLNPKRKT